MLLRMKTQSGRHYFILSIWFQPTGSDPDVWRGYVESAGGTRTYFATLQRLNELLQAAGWQEDTAVTKPESFSQFVSEELY